MKVVNKITKKDVTSNVLNAMYKRDGYKWIVTLFEDSCSRKRTFLKEDQWDVAMRYIEMDYKVEEIV